MCLAQGQQHQQGKDGEDIPGSCEQDCPATFWSKRVRHGERLPPKPSRSDKIEPSRSEFALNKYRELCNSGSVGSTGIEQLPILLGAGWLD